MKKKQVKREERKILGVTVEIKPKFRVLGNWTRRDIEKNGLVLEKVVINSEKDFNMHKRQLDVGVPLEYPLVHRTKEQSGFHGQRIFGKDFDTIVEFLLREYPTYNFKINYIYIRKGDILFVLKNYNKGAHKMVLEKINGKTMDNEDYQFDWIKRKLKSMVITDCPIYEKAGSCTICDK